VVGVADAHAVSMRRRLWTGALAAIVIAVLFAAPAYASDAKRREGSCSGSGRWELRVSRRSSGSLRVRFEVRDVPDDDPWQIFISDNGHLIYAGSKTSEDGRIRVRTVTGDRRGRDRIRAYAVDADTGESCSGAVRY
jgi:hypothetical protein